MLLARRGAIASHRRVAASTNPTRLASATKIIDVVDEAMAINCTGARLLVVGVELEHSSAVSAPTSVTYAGVAMTLGASILASGTLNWLGIYYLFTPTTGSNNVVVNLPAAGPTGAMVAAAYGGSDILSQAPEATDNDQGASGEVLNAISTATAGALILGAASSSSGTATFTVDSSPAGVQTIVDQIQNSSPGSNAAALGELLDAGAAGAKNFAWAVTPGTVLLAAAIAFEVA